MTRLPIPSGDDNTWGTILNDFLSVEHNADGSLKATGSLNTKADSAAVTNAQNDASSALTKINNTLDGSGIVLAGKVPAATTTVQGAVELATSAETITGTDTVRAVTPAGMAMVSSGKLSGFDVKAYGATGNGATDDTAAIRAAITAAGGADLHFPAGTYVITNLVIGAGETVRWNLHPDAVLLNKPASTAGATIVFTGDELTIRGGTLDGNKANVTNRPYFINSQIPEGSKVTIDNVNVKNCMKSFLYVTNFGGFASMTNCVITGQAEHNGVASSGISAIVNVSSGQIGKRGELRYNYNRAIGYATPTLPGSLPGGVFFSPAGYYTGTNRIQTVSLGEPTAGTFTLTFGGQTTTSLAYNASVVDVQAAMEALSSVGAGNCTVGTIATLASVVDSATAWSFTFGGTFNPSTSVGLITVTGTGLTGSTGIVILGTGTHDIFWQGNNSTFEGIGNYFYGYGQNCAGNSISPFHMYHNNLGARIEGNYLEQCLTPICVKAGKDVSIKNNIIIDGQVDPQNDVQAGCISYDPGWFANVTPNRRAVISGNIIVNPGGESVAAPQNAIMVNGSPYAPAKNVIIANNVINGGGVGIDLIWAEDFVVSGNIVDGGSTAGAGLQSAMRMDYCRGKLSISDNIFTVSNGYGIFGTVGMKAATILVANNHITRLAGAGYYGLTIRGCAVLKMTGNLFNLDSATAGISVTTDGTNNVGLLIYDLTNTVLQGSAPGVTAFAWASITAAQGQLRGTGTPLNVVTPNQIGTTYHQTDGAAGGILWVANGLTSASWVTVMQTAGGSPNIQPFTASATWTKPTGAIAVRAILIAGGSGGGSGRRGVVSTVRCGGGGGGGGGLTVVDFDAADLAATAYVAIGGGGAGGVAVATDDTSGNAGSPGVATTFGAGTNAVAAAVGTAGGGGTATGGTPGAVGPGTSPSGGGGTASATGGVGGNANAGQGGGGAGGSGGGITAANVASNGGVGQGSRSQIVQTSAGGVVDSTLPIQGTASVLKGVAGPGTGGGASSITTAAQAGANAVGYGSGGGGGGASLNGNNSGAGGAGSQGYALIISYF